MQGSGRLYEWHVVDDGKETRLAPPSSAVVTDATSARELALAGVGIAYLSEPTVRDDLRAGRLKWLLPDSASHEDGLFVYFPRRAAMAPKLRAFIDAAKWGYEMGSDPDSRKWGLTPIPGNGVRPQLLGNGV